jgi:hypothetical protein
MTFPSANFQAYNHIKVTPIRLMLPILGPTIEDSYFGQNTQHATATVKMIEVIDCNIEWVMTFSRGPTNVCWLREERMHGNPANLGQPLQKAQCPVPNLLSFSGKPSGYQNRP